MGQMSPVRGKRCGRRMSYEVSRVVFAASYPASQRNGQNSAIFSKSVAFLVNTVKP